VTPSGRGAAGGEPPEDRPRRPDDEPAAWPEQGPTPTGGSGGSSSGAGGSSGEARVYRRSADGPADPPHGTGGAGGHADHGDDDADVTRDLHGLLGDETPSGERPGDDRDHDAGPGTAEAPAGGAFEPLGGPPGTRPHGRRYLLDSERRVIFVRRHPALLLRYVLETLGALVVAGVLTSLLPDDVVLLDVVWYAVLAVMARLLYQVAEWSVDRFVVTDRRMMLISGLLTRRVAMMPLTKVTDMTYEKPVVGRLLGFGEFVMESAGQDQALHRIQYVPTPDRLYREVSELLFGGATASPKVVPSTAKARGAPAGQPSE
jgi:hypothetical protein